MTSTTNTKKKVAVGLSGGVDSSVAAMLLLKAGYDVVGVHMTCWDTKLPGCTADRDRADAVAVAAHLGIKFEALNFVEAYKKKVIDYFYAEYEKGRTPNPDVMCNKEIKFGLFYEWALANGFDYVATGHYARVISEANGHKAYKLLKGLDASKDQSYFLYLLTSSILEHVLFPLGELHKTQVRELAKEANLPTFAKAESMGICFVGEVDIKDFLKQRLPVKKGAVVTSDGELVGEHEGAWFYTVGQRHGFTVTKYTGIPMYVIGKNIDKNEIVVGHAREVSKNSFQIDSIHWCGGVEALGKYQVRVRHLGDMYDAVLEKKADASKDTIIVGTEELVDPKGLVNTNRLVVTTEQAVFGVAPGQSCVIYQGDEVLGGGIIC